MACQLAAAWHKHIHCPLVHRWWLLNNLFAVLVNTHSDHCYLAHIAQRHCENIRYWARKSDRLHTIRFRMVRFRNFFRFEGSTYNGIIANIISQICAKESKLSRKLTESGGSKQPNEIEIFSSFPNRTCKLGGGYFKMNYRLFTQTNLGFKILLVGFTQIFTHISMSRLIVVLNNYAILSPVKLGPLRTNFTYHQDLKQQPQSENHNTILLQV